MKDALGKIRHSAIKIFTQSDAPDYDQPWQMEGAVSAAGSGLIVATRRGPRILTNAHVVENQVFVELRRYGQSKKYVAEVEGVGHECDLAMLRVEEASFFTGTVPIPIGDLPGLGEQVTALGYPIGGDRLSLTQGVVSRIEMSYYAQSQRRLLSVQIDAAINAGNSGGPVVNRDGQLVGVAFQSLEEGENIGYIIGSPVVRHFMKDMDDGVFDGFPDLGIVEQSLESSAQRRWLGLPARQHGGILITGVVYNGSAWRCLKRGDVLLKIGSSPVASDRTVKFRSGERIHFSYVVSQRHVGDSLRATIWRSGQIRKCDIKLKPPRYLVAEDRFDVRPTYFIYGGLLFVPLTRDYLKTWGPDWWDEAPSNLIGIYESGIRTSSRREVVVLQKVLADRVNQGYHRLDSNIVTKVQGKKIRDLRHLVEILSRTRGEFVRFDLEDGKVVVLDRNAAEERRAKILKRFSVPSDRSDDLPPSSS